MKVRLKPGQTILDLALQQFGSLEGIDYLIEDNDYEGNLIVGDIEVEDQEIKIRADSVIDQTVVEQHSNNVIASY